MPVAKERLLQIARFAAVGLCATAIYFSLALAFVKAGMHVAKAHVIAYAVSILASYLGQKIFTFGVRGDHRRNGPRFILATAFIAAIQFGLVMLCKRLGASDLTTIVISTLYYPLASFVVHTFWTFRGGPARTPSTSP